MASRWIPVLILTLCPPMPEGGWVRALTMGPEQKRVRLWREEADI